MSDHVFFYGTLMAPFNRPGRLRITPKLSYCGRGTIRAALYDLGIYPAAVLAEDAGVVWGEVYETQDAASVLAALDEIEGYRPSEPDRSLYTRLLADVALVDGRAVQAWAYFYNAPLGRAQRITSGDYLEHLNGPRGLSPSEQRRGD
ncbi:MAG: gamma-glutamylcyclotransferase [Vicinamibacterales bacterium]